MVPRRAVIGAAPLLPLVARAQTKTGGRQMAEPPPISLPRLPERAPDVAGFVPPGWALEHRVTGDLDGDGWADLAMILRMQDPANILDNPGLGERRLDTNPRLLAVAFAVPGVNGGGYRLAEQDGALIPRRTNPVLEDPVSPDSLELVRGTLRLRLGRWASAGSYGTETRTLTFRWQGGRFEMIGLDSVQVHRATGELRELSVNFSTGRAVRGLGSIESDRKRERRIALPPRPPIPLREVGDGLAFDPGVPE